MQKLPDKFSLLTHKHNFYLVSKAWNISLTLFQCGKGITRRSFVRGRGQKMLSHAGISLNFGLINSITVELKWRIRFCVLCFGYYCKTFVIASDNRLILSLQYELSAVFVLYTIFVIHRYYPQLILLLMVKIYTNWSKQWLLVIFGI